MADVTLRKVRKAFDRTEVIKGVDLDIKDNQFTVFVGPSGCGKSTLLRLIAGLEDVTEGDILIDGQVVSDLPPAKRGIAMVFQSYALYPHMSVYDNMAFGLKLAKSSKQQIAERVAKGAHILQIEHLLQRKPKELSGGQRQRVAIGRAIVREPRVFLLDEPLSNLDAALRVQMRIELAKLRNDLKATMVYVTHDQVEAMTLADTIVVLNAGVVEQVGSPLELYHHPRNLFVAGFIGSPRMNFLETVVTGVGEGAVTVALPGDVHFRTPIKGQGLHDGEQVTLGVRPEHLLLESGGSDQDLTGTVRVVEHLGGETYLYVSLDEGRQVVIKAAGDSRTRVGDRVKVGIPGSKCHLFDQAGRAFERAGAERDAAPAPLKQERPGDGGP
jgi:multiple sugar transport system ATP-binding protein